MQHGYDDTPKRRVLCADGSSHGVAVAVRVTDPDRDSRDVLLIVEIDGHMACGPHTLESA